MRWYRLAVLVVAFAIAGTACDRRGIVDPGVEILLKREGQEYVFSFKTCNGAHVEASWIKITEGEGRKKDAEPYCEVFAPSPSTQGIRGDWRYATIPPGFEKKNCTPLRPNRVYEVQVAEIGGGRRMFFVRGDGSVELREGSCSAAKSM